jgi:hypothetical protein
MPAGTFAFSGSDACLFDLPCSCCYWFLRLSFSFAAKLIRQGKISITDLFVAFFSVMIGGTFANCVCAL